MGLRCRKPGEILVFQETAQAAKFDETIREALGRTPNIPDGFVDLYDRPQRVDVLPARIEPVKQYIVQRAKE